MKQDSTETNLILITGDLHVPHRVSEIPEEIKNVLSQKKSKFEYIITTGCSCDVESIIWLKSLLKAPNSAKNFIEAKSSDSLEHNSNLTLSKSNLSSLNEIESVKIGQFLISVTNGHQIIPWGDIESLSSIQKLTGCDILISGYTHKPSIFNFDGKYFINPGSLTGAYSPLHNDPYPSFIILLISGDLGVAYLYELNTSTKNLEISKMEINKIKVDQSGN